MKYFLILFGVLLAVAVHGQVLDTAQVRIEVDSFIKINQALVKERKFEEATQVIEVAKNKAEAVFGKMSVEYSNCVFNLGKIEYALRNYQEAKEYYLTAKILMEEVLGINHLDYANILSNLGNLYFTMGDYEEAEKFCLEVQVIRAKVLGTNHPDYANILNSLGVLYYTVSNYEKAEKYYLEAKVIRARELHIDYANTLNNLGILYSTIGNYKKAKEFHLEAKAILKKILGKNHLYYTNSLNNLGLFHFNLGNYERAEKFYLEAKAILEKLSSENHYSYANILENLGLLYFKMGNYERAEKFYIDTKAIRVKESGEKHANYANILGNLGLLYFNMSDYEKSEKYYLEAKVIFEKVLGKNHYRYANILGNLGLLYFNMSNYEESEKYYLETKVIFEKVLSKNHPRYANTLEKLGDFYFKMSNYGKAEKNHLKAKKIREKELGTSHPSYLESLKNLANVYFKMKNYEEAEKFYLEAYKVCVQQINTAFSFLSNQEKENFIKNKIESLTHQLQEAVFEIQSTKLYEMQYNLALLTKGLQLQTDISTLKFILAENDSTLLKNYDELLDIRRYLSKQYERPITERDSTFIVEKENQQQELEKTLARASTEFRANEELYKINAQNIQKSLQKNEAAIEFIHFNKTETDSVMYAAAILLPFIEEVHYIPLFEEKELEQLTAHIDNTVKIINQLYRGNNSEGVVPKDKQKLSQQLYKLIWQPLDSLLENTQTIYYSPSGLLHRLNMAAIPIDSTNRLSDRYELRQLSSTREIVLKDIPFQNTDALVFGGIDYDLYHTFQEDVIDSTENQASSNFVYDDVRSINDGKNWKPLTGAEEEAENINLLLNKAKFNSQVFQDGDATEEQFKTIGTITASPRVLHLATHGFFFPDVDTLKHYRDNPMLRSGLILAGANYAWEHGQAPPNKENGILTAYEISQMNLSQTELVVLSACETGLGDIKGSEGVFGLRRAFKKAGAKYLIISLWNVPDEQTKELMVSFYKKWLTEKMDIPTAFRAAQQEMRKAYSDKPYNWAGFVLVE